MTSSVTFDISVTSDIPLVVHERVTSDFPLVVHVVLFMKFFDSYKPYILTPHSCMTLLSLIVSRKKHKLPNITKITLHKHKRSRSYVTS